MSSIQVAKESAVQAAVGFVKSEFRNPTKAAILGGEDELQALLQVLPGTPVSVIIAY